MPTLPNQILPCLGKVLVTSHLRLEEEELDLDTQLEVGLGLVPTLPVSKAPYGPQPLTSAFLNNIQLNSLPLSTEGRDTKPKLKQ